MPSPLESAAEGAASRVQLWARFLRKIEAKTVAEIGVFRGEFAAKLLRRVPSIERYYLIDPWRHLDDWNKPANRDDDQFEGYYRQTVRSTDFAGDRRIFLRGTTLEVVDEVPDGSLDLAYIDGDHTLKGITIDLIRWYPKVRHGGWIAGDDFTRRLWQHGADFEPTLIFPFAVYFAEAVGVPIHGLRFNQFAIEKRPEAGFSFTDMAGQYGASDLQTLLQDIAPGGGRGAARRSRSAPIFIVGCGRSGTTALGEALGRHPDVTYLNEPRDVWGRDPRTDIWAGSPDGYPRIDLDDVPEEVAEEIRIAFSTRTMRGTVMVEKTPINAFRLGLLRGVYPDARIVHIVRNGLEVADSIADQHAEKGKWYGSNDSKWSLLADYAARSGLGDLATWCAPDMRRRGLLEWRLAVEAARAGLTEQDLEIRYEDLVDDPEGTLWRVARWAKLDPAGFPALDLARRRAAATKIDPDAERIAGELLRELGYPG